MKQFEFFTKEDYSVIMQSINLEEAIKHFRYEYGNVEIAVIIDTSYTKEFLINLKEIRNLIKREEAKIVFLEDSLMVERNNDKKDELILKKEKSEYAIEILNELLNPKVG